MIADLLVELLLAAKVADVIVERLRDAGFVIRPADEPGLKREIERLKEAKRRALMIADGAASAVVRRPIGAVAGAVHWLYGRTVDFAHSWGPNQSSTPRQPRSVARREQRVPTGESQPGSPPPAPQDQAAPQAAAPARPATTTSTAPPVQPLE